MSAAASRVRVPNEIRDLISRLNPDTKRRVRAALEEVVDDPDTGMALAGQLAGYRRIRIGGWRIVYRVERTTIQIHAIGRRSTVYADLIARIEHRGTASKGSHRGRSTSSPGTASRAVQHELRNESGKIMRALDRGERVVVTRSGDPIGERQPIRKQFVATEVLVAAFKGAPRVDPRRFRRDVGHHVNQDSRPRA